MNICTTCQNKEFVDETPLSARSELKVVDTYTYQCTLCDSFIYQSIPPLSRTSFLSSWLTKISMTEPTVHSDVIDHVKKYMAENGISQKDVTHQDVKNALRSKKT